MRDLSSFKGLSNWSWAIFTVRWVLGLIFFMAGWWKCFTLGPAEHARRFFLTEEFREGAWIPDWMLWVTGTTIPVVELIAGALVCLGLFRHAAYIALGAILVTVTYGHLLNAPLYDTTGHIFPRLVLLVFVWVAAWDKDILSLDVQIDRWRAASISDS